MAAKQNLTIDQGTDWSQRLEWKDANGDAIDITGWTARSMIRATRESSPFLVEMTTENGRIELGDPDPIDGVILLSLPNAVTDDLPVGNWYWDVELVSPGGLVTRLLQGRAKVNREITRPDPA